MKTHVLIAITSSFMAVQAFMPSVYKMLGNDRKHAIKNLASYFDANNDGVISLEEYQFGLIQSVENGHAPEGILENSDQLVCAKDGQSEIDVPAFEKCIKKKFKAMKISDWLGSEAYRGFDLDSAVVNAANDIRQRKCGPVASPLSDVDLLKCRNRSKCLKALMECPSVDAEVNEKT